MQRTTHTHTHTHTYLVDTMSDQPNVHIQINMRLYAAHTHMHHMHSRSNQCRIIPHIIRVGLASQVYKAAVDRIVVGVTHGCDGTSAQAGSPVPRCRGALYALLVLVRSVVTHHAMISGASAKVRTLVANYRYRKIVVRIHQLNARKCELARAMRTRIRPRIVLP